MRRFNKIITLNLRRFFTGIIVVLLITTLFSQLMLTIPDFRVIMSQTNRFESVFVNSQTDGIPAGEITLKINNCDTPNKARVLKNGVPIAVFFENTISVPVTDNSLIEIDGTKMKEPFSVDLITVSDEIIKENLNTTINVNSNICIMGRILFK